MESVLVSISIKMDLFKAINMVSSSSVEDLAVNCQADPILTARLLRGLASFGIVQAQGTGHYGPTSISKSFAERKNEVAVVTW
jgi:hypothetical protein